MTSTTDRNQLVDTYENLCKTNPKLMKELDNRPILAILQSRNYGTIIARDLESIKLIKETLKRIAYDMSTIGDKGN